MDTGDKKYSEDDLDEVEKIFPSKPKHFDPELDNFLNQVDQITDVIRGLSSGDPKENERALRQADILIQDEESSVSKFRDREIDENQVRVKSNRTIINKMPDKPADGGGEMSQDGFMRMVEKDAKERAENRRLRRAKSDKFRNEGNEFFAKQEYAAALDKYTKAIQHTKDLSHLYINRALTYIRLKIYSKAIPDCDQAIYLCPDSLKGRLYKAKAYYMLGDEENCKKILQEARETNPNSEKMIRQYEKEIYMNEP